MKIQHDEDYRKLRREAYPPMGEQLDAVVKLAQAMREQGVELPPETEAWINRCLAVKSKFPKPK